MLVRKFNSPPVFEQDLEPFPVIKCLKSAEMKDWAYALPTAVDPEEDTIYYDFKNNNIGRTVYLNEEDLSMFVDTSKK